MADTVTLLVPAEESYRALGPELARKYLEIAGGSAQDAEALAAAVGAALVEMARTAPDGAGVAMAFAHERASVDVHLECGALTKTVSQPLPAGKR